jgi:hypothetical protein
MTARNAVKAIVLMKIYTEIFVTVSLFQRSTVSLFHCFTSSVYRAKLTIMINIRLSVSFIVRCRVIRRKYNDYFCVSFQNQNMLKILKRPVILVIVILAFSISYAYSQDTIVKQPHKPKHNDFLSRLDFGGSLGLQFGSLTYIEVAPIARFRITEKLYTGLGLTYMYYKDNRYTPSFSLSSYGGSVFAGYFVWKDLFLHAEYAPLYIPNFYDYYAPPIPTLDKPAPWAHDILIGGGYRQWIGQRAFVNLMVLFNLNQTEFSPYSNPIIRIGFGAGL